MSQSLYELIALGARYLFAALMVLIVARAWRITLVDSRRAQTLRRLSPETGLSGELIVMEGDGKARRGMRYPVIREGLIGSARRADIRIRHKTVRRRHAWFQLTPEGLSLRAHADAPMRRAGQRGARELLLRDGDVFDIGRVRLMLVLTEVQEDGNRIEANVNRTPEPDEWFEAGGRRDAEDPFETNPVLNRRREEDEKKTEDLHDLFFDR